MRAMYLRGQLAVNALTDVRLIVNQDVGLTESFCIGSLDGRVFYTLISVWECEKNTCPMLAGYTKHFLKQLVSVNTLTCLLGV